MAGFRTYGAYVDALRAGQMRTFSWRKVVTPTTLFAGWLDLSVMPGNPAPQFYAATPLSANTMTGRPGSDGMPVGANVGTPTYNRYLHEFLIQTPSALTAPCAFMLLDLLMYYPFIDQGTTDAQAMDNGTGALSRYTDGEGVQIMAVLIFPQSGLFDSFVVTYTNSQGVAGRVTPLITCNNMTYLGGLLASSTTARTGLEGPFLPLQAGDTGVRSIESVQMTAGTDVGLFTLVLVKPIWETQLREQTAPVEVCCLRDQARLPQFYDNAYLSLIAQPNSSLAAFPFFGVITTSWG